MATKNLAEVLRKKLASDPKLAARVNSERLRMSVGSEIYRARVQAGLSQSKLAKLTGTRQSAIARLEDADYNSHSLKSLERIAAALGKRVEVRFVDVAQKERGASFRQSIRYAALSEESRSWKPRIVSNSPLLDFDCPQAIPA